MYGPLKGLYTGYLVVDGNGKENGSYCGIKCSGFGVKGLRSFDILSALRDLTKCRTHTECYNNTFPRTHAKQQGPRGQCPGSWCSRIRGSRLRAECPLRISLLGACDLHSISQLPFKKKLRLFRAKLCQKLKSSNLEPEPLSVPKP